MTTAAEKGKSPNPYSQELPGNGKMAILVPLIIGGALVVGALILWQTHSRKVRMAEMAKMEEEVRVDLLQAYRELRDLQPEAALNIAKQIEVKMAAFCKLGDPDYVDLQVARLLVEAESEFMRDCTASAAEVEAKFTEAMNLMLRASGLMWEHGLLGRARARLEQHKFEEAITDLNILLAGNPNFGSAYYWRAVAKGEIGDAEGAMADEHIARNMDSWPPLRDHLRDHCSPDRNLFTTEDE